ncbi:YchJ family protein [Chitinibacter tainanensis]|uniref:YchJ family protein n=1 Tax=Chitinibacter tainanensis TaxID=230667 RepID=UPI00048FF2C3|nr:YchJ family metal-binding protein [Chitinibacter tainanensis]
MANSSAPAASCPCGGPSYSQCCAPYHAGAVPPSPETLMRSRYSAYVMGLEDYLLASWHASTRPERLDLQEEPKVKWLGLTVHHAASDGDHGTVSFLARYKVGGRAYKLAEHSRFVREEGRWFYLDGDIAE